MLRRARQTVSALCAMAAVAAAIVTGACSKLDDERIPPMPVSLTFATVAQWNTYGIGGAMDYRIFIKQDRLPANYPYTAISATGFGGLLLVGDINGNPTVYDLACPVERRSDVRVFINTTSMVAECPNCHSTYDVFSLNGHPLSGPAAEQGFGLRHYYVGPGRGGEYMIVSN